MEDSLFEDGWEEGATGALTPDADADAEGVETGSAPAEVDAFDDRTAVALTALADLAQAALDAGGDSEQVQSLLCTASVAVADAGPPFTLTLVGPVVFRDRALVLVDAAQLARCAALASVLGRAGVGTLAFTKDLTESDLLSLAYAVERASHGDLGAMLTLATDGLRCGALPAPRAGGDPRKPDTELYTAAQVTRTANICEKIAGQPGLWPWPMGIDVIRRLELALNTNAAAFLRAVELQETPWTPAQVGMGAAAQCLLTLRSLGVALPIRRAAAHALLNLCLSGIGSSGVSKFCPAATETLPRLLRTWTTSGEDQAAPPQLTPHHLRVCALIHGIADAGEPAACKGVSRLLALLYGLALWRADARAPGRSLADVFALAVAEPQAGFDAPWLNAAMRANNLLPIGTGVQMADGRFGVVVDPGRSGHPLQPLVQVGEQVVAADKSVRPVPAR